MTKKGLKWLQGSKDLTGGKNRELIQKESFKIVR
jgi:hypothetical protein